MTAAETSKATHAHSEDALRAARDAETAKKQSVESAERDLERLKAEANALNEMLATPQYEIHGANWDITSLVFGGVLCLR